MNFSKNLIELTFGQDDVVKSIADVEVDAHLVDECTNLYIERYNHPENVCTAGVSFEKTKLLSWLAKMENDGIEYDKIDILFGIYTEAFVNHYKGEFPHLATMVDRITAFIGLFKGSIAATRNDGTRAGLYNIGDLKPPTIEY